MIAPESRANRKLSLATEGKGLTSELPTIHSELFPEFPYRISSVG